VEPLNPTRIVITPSDVVANQCSCAEFWKFDEWLYWDCKGAGFLAVAAGTYFDKDSEVIPALLHASKARLLSTLRTCKVDFDSLMRLQADNDGPEILREEEGRGGGLCHRSGFDSSRWFFTRRPMQPSRFPACVWSLVRQYVYRHEVGWTASDHYDGCGQSCPCCRFAAGEAFGACEVCSGLRTLASIDVAVRIAFRRHVDTGSARRTGATEGLILRGGLKAEGLQRKW